MMQNLNSNLSFSQIIPSSLEPMPRNKLFHFEEIWLTNPRCGETVEAAWLLGVGGGGIEF